MRFLYILGNGFDLAQGLSTSYKDFYSYLMGQTSDSSLEVNLKKSISGDYNTWADLEKGLGEYSAQFLKISDFKSVLSVVNRRLKEFLLHQESVISTKTLYKDKLIQDVCFPEQYLEPQGLDLYRRFVEENKRNSEPIEISFVTFNYTDTLESVLGVINQNGGLLRNRGNQAFYYSSILHIHGSLDDMILVGVDNVGQIKNEKFRNDQDLIDSFVKPEINEGCMNTRNSTFSRLIKKADIIVLFGTSIGETDSIWWNLIGEVMDLPINYPLLLYFPFDSKKDTILSPNYKRRWSNQYIEELKEKFNSKSSLDVLRQRICIGINKDFLKLTQ